MSFTTSGLPLTLTVTFIVLVLLPTQTYAFGAGEIPDFSYLSGGFYSKKGISCNIADIM
jgi:hypothetical protein